MCWLLFFFNDPATPEIYTLSLHDALPIFSTSERGEPWQTSIPSSSACSGRDRKSTRLNSSHLGISYAVFCLKKKICPLALMRKLVLLAVPPFDAEEDI